MKKDFTILVADRNRYVREFLKRELEDESYRVLLAKNGQEVLTRIDRSESFDLLILDPDLPDADESSILKKLQHLTPTVPVVLHTFLSDHATNPDLLKVAAFVEKRGNSIERLKTLVSEIFRKSYS